MANEKEIQRLEEIAKHYRSTEGFNAKMSAWAYEVVKQHQAGGNMALEVGCSDGELTRRLVESSVHKTIIAVDGSKTQIERLNKKVQGTKKTALRSHACLFEEFETNLRFNEVYLHFVLEHVLDPVVMLKQVKKVCAPDARVHIVVPNTNSLHRRIAFEMGLIARLDAFSEQDKLDGHLHHFNLGQLTGIARDAGFGSIQPAKGILLKPFSAEQMVEKCSEEQMEGMFKAGIDMPELCAAIYLQLR